MGTAYAIIQEARIRSYKEQVVVLTDRNAALEREAKEYVAIILTLGAQDGISLEKAKVMASRVLRGEKGYG